MALRKPPHPERSPSPLGEGEQSKDAAPAIQCSADTFTRF
jgi:hypothetical protein